MGKNIIVSEETIRGLLEAHASLSAWYYELSGALRAAHAGARTPDDATRAAFVERLAVDFPEVAAVARSIKVPRMFVPPPPAYRAPPPGSEPALEPLAAPAAAEPAAAELAPAAAPTGSPVTSGVAPPPLVNPAQVKYGQ
jgi:hypothetical protein